MPPLPALDTPLRVFNKQAVAHLGLIIEERKIDLLLQLGKMLHRQREIFERPRLGNIIPLVHVFFYP